MKGKARVAIVGYGVIGRRVADAVRRQPDMEVVGVAGRPTSFSLRDAQLRGYDVFVTDQLKDGDAACRWGVRQGTLRGITRTVRRAARLHAEWRATRSSWRSMIVTRSSS